MNPEHVSNKRQNDITHAIVKNSILYQTRQNACSWFSYLTLEKVLSIILNIQSANRKPEIEAYVFQDIRHTWKEHKE